MADTIDNRANSQQNISGKQGSRPKAVPYSDFSMASLAPIGTPQQNVTGQLPGAADEANQLVADAGAMQLGTSQWEEAQLVKAIERLREQYSRAAAASGGSMNDPYWKSEYDKAVDAALDDIRSQSATNRQTTEEAQKSRDFSAEQSKLQQAHEREVAREHRKAAENAAMFQAGGGGLMNYLTTPRGGSETKLGWGVLTDPKTGTPLMNKVYSPDGKTVVSESPMMGPVQTGVHKPAETPLETGFKGAGSYAKGAFSKSGEAYSGDPFAGGKKVTQYNNPGSFLVPTLAGTGAGMLMPSKNKGNALLQAGGGFAASGLDSAFGGSSPWSKLATSFGGAWANPFNKGSWGKNTSGTLAKLGGTAALGYLGRGAPGLLSGLSKLKFW